MKASGQKTPQPSPSIPSAVLYRRPVLDRPITKVIGMTLIAAGFAIFFRHLGLTEHENRNERKRGYSMYYNDAGNSK